MKLEGMTSKEQLTLLGAVIKLNRLSQNMSQAGLAEGICVPSYLSKIENGEIVPSLEVLQLLFNQLDIEYGDDEGFIKTHYQLILDYFEEVSFNGFEKANEIFNNLQSREEQLIHSSLIVDYYLLKLAHFTATPDRKTYETLKRQLEQVTHVLTPNQQYTYHFYIAIDTMMTYGDINESLHHFKEATKRDQSGKSYYFLAVAYFKMGRYYEAMSCVEQAQKLYLEQAQLSHLILCYELKALLAYRLNGLEESITLLNKAIEMSRVLKREDMSLNSLSFLAYLYFKEENNPKTIDYLNKAVEVANDLHYQSDLAIIITYIAKKLQLDIQLSPDLYQDVLSFSNFEDIDYDKVLELYVSKTCHHIFVDFFIFDFTIAYYMTTRRYKEAVNLLQKGYHPTLMMRKSSR